MKPVATLFVLVLLAACGGRSPPEPEPQDPAALALQQDRRLARAAFEARNYAQAAVLYERVIAAAYARDDLAMIADARYELAVVSLRQGDAATAASLARRTRAELVRRGVDPFAELFLVEAAARLRLGEPDLAETLLVDALARSPEPGGAVALRAAYLRGVMAAERGDAAAVRAALALLAASGQPTVIGDRHELEGRLARIEGRDGDAVAAFAAAAETRREANDLEGLAEALALGADAALAAGDRRQAADLYLRAGRSAQERGDTRAARRWLTEASRAARRGGLELIRREAQERLDSLPATG